MNEVIQPSSMIHGGVRAHRIFPGDEPGPNNPWEVSRFWKPHGHFEHNDVMYDWASIVGELLRNAPDRKPYHIGGLYMEFENNGGAVVSAPSFGRGGGIAYYTSLLTSPTRDYLRVPLTGVAFNSTDMAKFPDGNKLTFFAQTDGVTGVHGKAFNDAMQSRIYGGALVAFPDFGDATQDLVFARFYFADTANQLIKLVGSQVGFEWNLVLQ